MTIKVLCLVQRSIIVLITIAIMPFLPDVERWLPASQPAIAQTSPLPFSPAVPNTSSEEEAYWNEWTQRWLAIQSNRPAVSVTPPAAYLQEQRRLATQLGEATTRGDAATAHQLAEASLNLEQRLRGAWLTVKVEQRTESTHQSMVQGSGCPTEMQGQTYVGQHYVFHYQAEQEGWLYYYDNSHDNSHDNLPVNPPTVDPPTVDPPTVEYKLQSPAGSTYYDMTTGSTTMTISPDGTPRSIAMPVQRQGRVLEASGFLQSIVPEIQGCHFRRENLEIEEEHPSFHLQLAYEGGVGSIDFSGTSGTVERNLFSTWGSMYSLNLQDWSILSLSPADIQTLFRQGSVEKTVSWTSDRPDYQTSVTSMLMLRLTLQPVTEMPVATTSGRSSPSSAIATVTYHVPVFWPDPHYLDLEFDSCRAAENHLDMQKENDHVAEVVWGELEVEPNVEIRGTTLRDGRIQAEVTVNYQVVPPVRSITLPRLTWPNMTTAERDRLQSFMNGLMNHEEGHVDLAQAFANANSGRSVAATGATAAEATTKLRAQVEAELNAARADLRLIQDEYDEVTDHGVHQTAVQNWTETIGYPQIGIGPNTVLTCP